MERGLAIVLMLRPGLGRTPSPGVASWDPAARPLSSGAAASKASCKAMQRFSLLHLDT